MTLGFIADPKEAPDGGTATFFYIAEINVNRRPWIREATIVLEWYRTPQTFGIKQPTHTSFYKISLNTDIPDEELEELGYISKASQDEIDNIYTPTINRIYDTIAALFNNVTLV